MSDQGSSRYSTHPTVVAAATVVGVVGCISIVLWTSILIIGPIAYEDSAIIFVIGAIISGLILWAMVKSVVRSDMESQEDQKEKTRSGTK